MTTVSSFPSLRDASARAASGKPSKLAFLMSPSVPSATDHSSTATGTLGRSASFASNSLRQFASHAPAAPNNPATRLMRSQGGLRPRPLSVVSSSDGDLATISQSKSSKDIVQTLSRHAPPTVVRSPPEEERQSPPSPARSTTSDRAFSGLDPTSRDYGSGMPSRSHSANSSHSDLSSQSKSAATNGLDTALAAAEDRSKLRTGGSCTNCGMEVVNAAMNRQGQIFCGRTCRIETKAKSAAPQA
jgi:hypothetical protein